MYTDDFLGPMWVLILFLIFLTRSKNSYKQNESFLIQSTFTVIGNSFGTIEICGGIRKQYQYFYTDSVETGTPRTN